MKSVWRELTDPDHAFCDDNYDACRRVESWLFIHDEFGEFTGHPAVILDGRIEWNW